MADEAPGQPTDEELRDQLEAELKKLKVADILVQTLFTVSSLGFHRLTSEDRDLDQARLAIETIRALVPLLTGAVPEQLTRDLEQTLASLQLAYAKAVADA
jgi:hypothetical protein